MGKKKTNKAFLSEYIQLDKDCCGKFGVSSGGVTEYINRLNNARFAPGRDDVLPRLVRYRNTRNKLVHELSALRKSDDVTKADVRWVRFFNKSIKRKKDPISRYLRKARKYVRRRKLRRWLITLLILALIAGAGAAAYMFLL